MEALAMLVLIGVVGVIVLPPLFRRSGSAPARGATVAEQTRQRDRAADVLRELEFDHATGKLADDDYRTLRARYETVAAAAVGAAAPAPLRPRADGPRDRLEAEILAARRARRFCAGCGTALPRAARYCPACGATVEGPVAEESV